MNKQNKAFMFSSLQVAAASILLSGTLVGCGVGPEADRGIVIIQTGSGSSNTLNLDQQLLREQLDQLEVTPMNEARALATWPNLNQYLERIVILIERKMGDEPFKPIHLLQNNDRSYSDNDLSNRYIYQYRMRAVAPSVFDLKANEVSLILSTFIQAPNALSADLANDDAMGLTAIKISFNDRSTNESHFVIERFTTLQYQQLLNGVDVTPARLLVYAQVPESTGTIEYNDNDGQINTTYYYRVKAIHKLTEQPSAYSNVVEIHVP